MRCNVPSGQSAEESALSTAQCSRHTKNELTSMPDRRITVFFYGLFMEIEALRAKGLQPSEHRLASVSGFALRIGQRATLVPDPNSRVYGFTMQLTHTEVEQLYSDPSVSAYRPEAVLAHFIDGSAAPALSFNLVIPPAPGESNPQYAAKLRDLAQRLQLPSDYVASIR